MLNIPILRGGASYTTRLVFFLRNMVSQDLGVICDILDVVLVVCTFFLKRSLLHIIYSVLLTAYFLK